MPSRVYKPSRPLNTKFNNYINEEIWNSRKGHWSKYCDWGDSIFIDDVRDIEYDIFNILDKVHDSVEKNLKW